MPAGRPRWPWFAAAGAVVLIALLIAGYFVFVKDDSDQGEILLEAATSEGDSPWTPTVSPPGSPTTLPSSMPTIAPREPTSEGAGVIAVSGGRTGLYGGSLQLSVCDKARLIGFLEENPGQRAAFAEVLGITDVAGYVTGLTVVILGSDTRVTNHGYDNGRPTPIQSVLQAGTAVLVDEYGVPRVRCACGNPLLPAQPAKAKPAYTGPKWPGWDPDRIIIIQAAPTPLTQITIIDVDSGSPVTINIGSGTPVAQPAPQAPEAPVPTQPPPARTQPPPARTQVPVPRPQQPVPQTQPPQTQPPQTQAAMADWSADAQQYRGQDGGRASFACPPNGSLDTVWGSGYYTDDSSVCNAAVHAGVITREAGGTVIIEISPGMSSYQGSTANGVTSLDWGSWGGSFQVAGSG
ncbi:LCCL domain-containing protein [Aldersonia kunmingensis]|uniref:LCCL domain-containing protein n=1 Tax=Aldersonia kunmingensis TaxID=408066 RepID=UPI00082DC0B9|nr:DUF6777 domain-containing protein [Aldersonia kunmingensis]